MRLGYDLNINQSQKLIMTPQLRQAITILQLSTLELRDYVLEQLETNPVLELKEENPEETFEKDEEFEPEWLDYFSDSSDLGHIPGENRERSEVFFPQHDPGLEEYLRLQLSFTVLGRDERRVAEYLLGCIDERGYLQADLPRVALEFSVPPATVHGVVGVLQSLEPAGVAARDLKECLLLQLQRHPAPDELAGRIIEEHLQEIGEGRITRVAKSLKVSPGRVQEAIDFIKTLDPKPGSQFGKIEDNSWVLPDLFVERIGEDLVVLPNDSRVPKLVVNDFYRKTVRYGDEEVRHFIEKKLNAALWLIRGIEQRRQTLLKVMECIVRLQRGFFRNGPSHLKPMTLKDVADRIGMHESTVSRASNGKYVQTPVGLYEIRYFFQSGIERGGEEMASSAVKKEIGRLVREEDPENPLSDQQITEALADSGIKISRRTVAKYREELGILSSTKRKRYR